MRVPYFRNLPFDVGLRVVLEADSDHIEFRTNGIKPCRKFQSHPQELDEIATLPHHNSISTSS